MAATFKTRVDTPAARSVFNGPPILTGTHVRTRCARISESNRVTHPSERTGHMYAIPIPERNAWVCLLPLPGGPFGNESRIRAP